MSDLSLYDLSVPIFSKRLTQASHCLKKGEEWANENGKPLSTLVEARIYEDMRPLAFQVQTMYRMIIYFMQYLELPGAPKELPPVVETMEALRTQIEEMHALVAKITPESLAGKAKKEVKFGPPGRDPWTLTGLSFVQEFILVNFFFHATTLYDILRMLGVQLGKMDFIGKMG